MAGDYKKLWDEAKKRFEKEAGAVIAKRVAETAAKDRKHISELKSTDDGPKLKKPAGKFWIFGLIRTSSEMEPACKRLDKAADAKTPSERDQQKAFEDYEKDRKTYQKMLETAANKGDSPYNSVKPQIEALGNAMVKIGRTFQLKIKGSKDKRNRWLSSQANALSPFCREMGEHLDYIRGRNDDFDWNEKKGLGPDISGQVRKAAEKLMKDKLIPGLEALQKSALDQGFPKPHFDSIVRSVQYRISDPINESDPPSHIREWFRGFEDDIQQEVKRLIRDS